MAAQLISTSLQRLCRDAPLTERDACSVQARELPPNHQLRSCRMSNLKRDTGSMLSMLNLFCLENFGVLYSRITEWNESEWTLKCLWSIKSLFHCRVRHFPGTLQASVFVAVYGTWLRSRRQPKKTVRNAAAALKRIVKEDTKTRTASTRDLWGVIIRAPIQQFRWKFWKPALGTASFMKVLHL